MTGSSPSSSIQRRRLAMTQQVISEQELDISRLRHRGADCTERETELSMSENVRSSLKIELADHASEGSWVR